MLFAKAEESPRSRLCLLALNPKNKKTEQPGVTDGACLR